MIPVTPRTTYDLTEWCRLYQNRGTVPQPRHIRFGIGVYQISQGMSWHISSPVKWQSYCAAAMHFIMCAEAYDESLHNDLPDQLSEIPETSGSDIWKNLLLALGKAQQQIIYHPDISGATTRSSRYNREVLRDRLRILVTECFALTPREYREQGCFDEMQILMGSLVKK